jgi:hypothetical protein
MLTTQVKNSEKSIGAFQGNVGGHLHVGDRQTLKFRFDGAPTKEVLEYLNGAFKNLGLNSPAGTPLTPSSLVEDKLSSPWKEQTLEESIALLIECIRQGVVEAEKAEGKEIILFIGNTGAGKSTTINYLCGCTMELISPDDLLPPIKAIDDLVVVVKPPPQGAKKEVMAIGHTKESKTFMPHIETDTETHNTYMDCPGFLDNRGPEINIAKAFNIKNSIKKAKAVKVILLINYHSLKAERGRGLDEMLKIAYHLFGNEQNLLRAKEALLIGVTNILTTTSLSRVKNFLVQDHPTLQKLQDRLFIYDPLDRDITGAWKRPEFLTALNTLKAVPHYTQIFSTVLTHEDENKLLSISEQISQKIHHTLLQANYPETALYYPRLKTLSIIDHPIVERLLKAQEREIENHTLHHLSQFRASCYKERFVQAQELLKTLQVALIYFQDLDRLIHLPELQSHYDACLQQQQDKKNLQELSRILEAKKKEMELLLKALQESHIQKLKSLELKIKELAAEKASRLAAREQERQVAYQFSDPELQKKSLEEKQKLEADYTQKLAQAEQEKQTLLQEYQKAIEEQKQAHAEEQAQLKAQIALFKAQQQCNKIFPRIFGKADWEKHIGTVGDEPLLPPDIEQIMNGPCPFWEGKKVHETHLLVLVPEAVYGKPLTLGLLGELVQNPLQGHETEYNYFNLGDYQDSPAPASHWALMTRDVLPGSRSKRYKEQQAIAQSKPGYQIPTLLDAVTVVFMEYVRSGRRLYSNTPWTFTRCQEKYTENQQLVIGGFSTDGLDVIDSGFGLECDGVGGLRKF